ncbi:hypothetical protein [Halopiger djelfimassiliensis]|nr:hypothetical protein [Halopiger djelfimassiliensis]
MASDGSQPTVPDDMSPEEARRHLIRLLGRQDLAEHEAIYDELARE